MIYNNNNNNRVCAQLLFNICKEIGVKLDNKHGMTLYITKISRNKS